MDLEAKKREMAQAIQVLEAKTEVLVNALAHDEVWIELAGEADRRGAVRRACEAIATIDYAMEDETNQTADCVGVIGVSAETLKRAHAVNEAKLQLKTTCSALKDVRIRVPKKGGAGTIAIPATRVVLRNIQRSDLNLMAAYRKIPILGAPPQTITYTVAHTRNVYRMTVEKVFALLLNREGPGAARDRLKLESLSPREKYLALAREHYISTRANITYTSLDRRGRGRVQIRAELPLMFALRKKELPPAVNFPAKDSAAPKVRRTRQPLLEDLPYLETQPIYRYLKT